jgi:hypothetical protein
MTTYIQLAHRLRINGRDGRPDRVSERPRQGGPGAWGPYLDDPDTAPTLIELGPDDADIGMLLRSCAVRAYSPPAAEAPADAAPAERGKRRG